MIQQLIDSFLERIVFLIVLLPVVGAGLVLLFARANPESGRRVAITNSLLSVALVSVMLANFSPHPVSKGGSSPQFQMVTSLRWISTSASLQHREGGLPQLKGEHTSEIQFAPSPRIRIAFGVDGINLPFIVLVSLITLPAILLSTENRASQSGLLYAVLLLFQSSLLGCLAALDVLLFVVCFEASCFLLLILVGYWGKADRQDAVQCAIKMNVASSLCILFGVIGLTMAYSWMTGTEQRPKAELNFSMSHLSMGIPIQRLWSQGTAAIAFWEKHGPWILGVLSLGFIGRMGVFPFHGWFQKLLAASPPGVAVLFCAGFLNLGTYGLLRLVLPAADVLPENAVGSLQWMALIGLLCASLLMLIEQNFIRFLGLATAAHQSFCLLALWTIREIGPLGVMLQVISFGIASTILIGVHCCREANEDQTSTSPSWPNWISIVAVLSLLGIPGLLGFPAKLMMFLGIYSENPVWSFWVLAAGLISAGAWIRMLNRTWLRKSQPQNLSLFTKAIPACFCGLLILLGLVPQLIVSRCEFSVARMMSLRIGNSELTESHFRHADVSEIAHAGYDNFQVPQTADQRPQ